MKLARTCTALVIALIASTALLPGIASAQTKIKMTLNWKYEGPQAWFFLAQEKGYFKAEGLDVEIDQGEGSAAPIPKLANGAYDAGFGDLNALIDMSAKFPNIVVQNTLAPAVSIKADRWIRRMAAEHRMIEPFEPGQVKQVAGRRVVSYGTSSYGYDIRCAAEFKIFTNINSTIVDPKAFDEKNFVDYRGEVCIIPPNSFALARTVEYFRIPRNVLTICLGKSTYARCGIIVNVTPLEPEWEGHVTLEFSNTTPLPARVYANEGVAQVIFIESDEPCETSYRERGGKYQGQKGVTLPRI